MDVKYLFNSVDNANVRTSQVEFLSPHTKYPVSFCFCKIQSTGMEVRIKYQKSYRGEHNNFSRGP